MAPPPATLASSSKFLLPKRQHSQNQHHTPSQLPGPARQFNATPRFSVSSTPRGPSSQAAQFSTPAVLAPRSASTRSRGTQDLIDIESSPESSDGEPQSDEVRQDVHQSVDIATSFISQSPGEEYQGGRSPKRRRISISPVLDSSPPHPIGSDGMSGNPEIDVDPSVYSSQPSEDIREHLDQDSEAESRDHEQESYARPPSPHRFLFQSEPQADVQLHQGFKPPPQFKAPSATTSLQPQYPLPDAFSPQRRGPKYVNGGLAGELRDWLVDVKGASDAPTTATVPGNKVFAAAEVAITGLIDIDEVRRANGFFLVRGHDTNDEPVHMVLAGEGRLSRLAERRNLVTVGSPVMTLPPMWDIELEGQRWTVACDWYVADHGG